MVIPFKNTVLPLFCIFNLLAWNPIEVLAKKPKPGKHPVVVVHPLDEMLVKNFFGKEIQNGFLLHPDRVFDIQKPNHARYLQKAVPYIAGILAAAADSAYRSQREKYLMGKNPEAIGYHRGRYEKAELARNIMIGVFSTLFPIEF